MVADQYCLQKLYFILQKESRNLNSFFYLIKIQNTNARSFLGNVGEIILDLLGREPPEALLVADADLHVVLVHLALKALLEGQDGRVHGVLQLELLVEPLLEERLAVDEVLAHGRGLPGEVGARGVALEEVGLALLRVPAADEEGDPEWPDAAGLRVLLHHHRHAGHQLGGGDRLLVHQLVVLGRRKRTR